MPFDSEVGFAVNGGMDVLHRAPVDWLTRQQRIELQRWRATHACRSCLDLLRPGQIFGRPSTDEEPVFYCLPCHRPLAAVYARLMEAFKAEAARRSLVLGFDITGKLTPDEVRQLERRRGGDPE